MIIAFFVGDSNLKARVIEPTKEKAQGCIIWLHGLGANADDMMGLVEQLPATRPLWRHVFLDAPVRPVTINNNMVMPAWYDIYGLESQAREDRSGVLASEAFIQQVIQEQLIQGFSSDKIVLAGFSQGGAMALFTGLRSEKNLGGVMCLSGYLPLAAECQPRVALTTPLFFGYGVHDTVVLPLWSQQSILKLQQHGYQNISVHSYPIEHTICLPEIQDISAWLMQRIDSQFQMRGV